jgi:carboxyl-terminal processing protease
VADSLKTAFKTKNSRSVYDGGGVEPDIKTDIATLSALTVNLLQKNYVFDYATKYYFEHANQKPKEKFSLTEAEYQDFISWLNSKDFTYKTTMEHNLDNLEASAKKENSLDLVHEQIKSLREKINQGKQQDLVKNKDDIKVQLEAEILSRYYFQKAMKFVAFDRDREVQEALKLFKDIPRYNSILKGGK